MHTADRISALIQNVRAHRIILSPDLAALYGVETRVLTQAVRRNPDRFPGDFCFPLAKHELTNLKSQSVTSSWGGTRKPPLAFTEHGALMAATVLNSPRAIEVSVFVIRAFIALREAARSGSELRAQLQALERKVGTHDRAIAQIFEALRRLTAPPDSPSRAPKRRIGFL